jgi:hypothetical protein
MFPVLMMISLLYATTGCATAFAIVLGTLLEPSPVVRESTKISRRETRTPYVSLRKTITDDTTPAYAGPRLRAVHAPAVTPVHRSRPRAAATHASSRAMVDEKASDEFIMHALQETPRICYQHAVGIPGEHKQVLMGLLAGAVGAVLLGKIVHKVNYYIITSSV